MINNQLQIQTILRFLDLSEYKAIIYIISKIRPGDEPEEQYIFECKEFQQLIGWSRGASYTKTKAMLTKLSGMRWWIELENGERSRVGWFGLIRTNPGTDEVRIKFHGDLFMHLKELQQYLEFDIIRQMKNKFSPRLYSLLKSNKPADTLTNKSCIFENGTGSEYDLQRVLADTEPGEDPWTINTLIPGSWSNWAVFKRDVLEPAVMEINKYSDLDVFYTGKKEDLGHRKTRAIRTIEFREK